ncbi:MAG: hypothetical protein ACOYEV_18835 [Candidatus Nanopelagicales bacterium]
MTITAVLTRAPQRSATVLRAESRRSLRQGGLRVGLMVAALASITLGGLSILLIEYSSAGQPGESAWLSVAIPVKGH